MKTRHHISAALAALALLASGCTDDFDKINTDPDAYADAPVTNMLAYTLESMAEQWGSQKERLADWSGYLVADYENETFQYLPSHNEFGNKWYTTYTLQPQLQDILDRTTAEDNKNMQLVARLLKQYLYFLTADCYGDIPYSEAAKGLSEGIIHPKYDKAEDVYAGIERELKDIADAWAGGIGGDPLGGGDLLYGGDASLWQRLCNSLRLRLAMRLSNMPSHLDATRATFKEILGQPDRYPVIEESSQNAYFRWDGSASYREPWYDNYLERPVDYNMSEVFVDYLLATSDPRIATLCRPAVATGLYRGVKHGANTQYNGEPRDNYSLPGALYMAQNPTENSANPGFSPYFRAAETWMLIAEAALRGFDTGTHTAQSAYEKAVRCSMTDNKVSEADAQAFLDGPGHYDGTLDQVYNQLWVALYKQGQEAWCLYRRTGAPRMLLDEVTYSDGVTAPQYPGEHSAWGYGASARHNDLPFRFPYPSNEYEYNSDNLAAAAQGIADYCWGKRLCWARDNGLH